MDEALSSERAAEASMFRGKYLSVISYKRDGTSVATPVWFVEEDGRLLVGTGAASGKVKRIRRPSAGAGGGVHGERAAARPQVPGRDSDLQTAVVPAGRPADRKASDQAGDAGHHASPVMPRAWR